MVYQGKASSKLLLTVTMLLSSTAAGAAAGTPVAQLPVPEKVAKHLDPSLEAPIQIIVSRKDQRLRVFKGGEEIATSRVSTGKSGHTTPTGIYSILEKRRSHFSNLYNSAPMPYMQRLTWSGIALHQSNSVPSYPASHGCVRLPAGFAKQLFTLTERGAHVVIANRDAVPELISHQALFQPEEMTSFDELSSVQAAEAKVSKAFGKIELLSDKPPLDPLAHQIAKRLNRFDEIRDSEKPLRIFITRQAKGNLVREVQTLLNELGYDAGEPDGLVGKMTLTAVSDFVAARNALHAKTVSAESAASTETAQSDIQSDLKSEVQPDAEAKRQEDSQSPKLTTTIDQTLLAELYQAAGKGEVPTGHLFVRHNFKPLFDAPIQIRNPEQALGAHLFTASLSREEEGKLDWRALSLGDKLTAQLQESYGVTEPVDEDGIVASQDILDRIVIPESVRAQINHLIGNGASLTISDRGFSRETTPQGTDFIVLTKPTLPKYATKTPAKVKKQRVVTKITKPKRTVAEVKKPKSRGVFSLFKRRSADQVASN